MEYESGEADVGLKDLEEYKDNKVIGGASQGEYGAATVTGADGKLYASIIDKEDGLIYSLIKIDSADSNNAGNGYYQIKINRAKKITDPDGVPLWRPI